MISPTLLIGAAAIVVAFGAGYKVADNAAAKREAKAVLAAHKAYEEKADDYLRLSAAYESLRTERAAKAAKLVTKIERIVERPAYAGDCLDDDGLRVVNEALTGASNPSEPVDAVPANRTTR